MMSYVALNLTNGQKKVLLDNLKVCIELKKITLEALASGCSVSIKTLRDLQNGFFGATTVATTEVEKIATYFNVVAGDLTKTYNNTAERRRLLASKLGVAINEIPAPSVRLLKPAFRPEDHKLPRPALLSMPKLPKPVMAPLAEALAPLAASVSVNGNSIYDPANKKKRAEVITQLRKLIKHLGVTQKEFTLGITGRTHLLAGLILIKESHFKEIIEKYREQLPWLTQEWFLGCEDVPGQGNKAVSTPPEPIEVSEDAADTTVVASEPESVPVSVTDPVLDEVPAVQVTRPAPKLELVPKSEPAYLLALKQYLVRRIKEGTLDDKLIAEFSISLLNDEEVDYEALLLTQFLTELEQLRKSPMWERFQNLTLRELYVMLMNIRAV